ncbi:hypothetical protein PilKf_00452 [Pillotina sp. SPG140]
MIEIIVISAIVVLAGIFFIMWIVRTVRGKKPPCCR